VARMRVGDRRRLLVQAALRVMSDRGLAAVTTRSVVAEAGMSLGSFHYAFQSEQEMLAETIKAATVQMTGAPARFEAGSDDPAAVIVGVLNGYLRRIVAAPGLVAAVIELGHHGLRVPALHDLVVEQHHAHRIGIATAFDAMNHQFGWRWTLPAGIAERLIMSILVGVAQQWINDRDTYAARATLVAAAASLADCLDVASTDSARLTTG